MKCDFYSFHLYCNFKFEIVLQCFSIAAHLFNVNHLFAVHTIISIGLHKIYFEKSAIFKSFFDVFQTT